MTFLREPAFLLLFFILLVVGGVVALVLWAVTSTPRRAAGPSVATLPSVPVPPPGWYPQPDGTQRYWDGQSWTEPSS